MKIQLLTLALTGLGSAALFAQGPLLPTGAPAPTMKSLAQIEPRTPIPATGPFPFTISASGSYYLTGNVTVATGHAIVINANDVTLDLAGFTIASTSATLSGKGILIDGSLRTNVSISNGFIRGTSVYNFGSNNVTGGGFTEAVGANGSLFGGAEGALAPTAVRISSLGISGVGAGVVLNPSSVSNAVENTTVSNVQGTGIRAGVISDSTADRTGSVSIAARSVSNVGGSRYTAGPAVDPAPVAPLVRADLETRTAIPGGTATFTISTPGSYVLAGNITVSSGHGIVIQADDVTLDLGGFTIASTAVTATGDAIRFEGARSRVAIANGHIRSGTTHTAGAFSNGPGFESGINWPSSEPAAIRISAVSVTGVKVFGIDVGNNSSSIVQGCTVRVAGEIGIRAGVVSDCSVTTGGATTITAARIANSVGARADGTGSGLVTTTPTLDAIGPAVDASAAARDRRTPISSAGLTLGSGSYYLTQNLTVSSGTLITIAGGAEVTLDLAGFTLASTATTGIDYGINIGTGGRTTIFNGTIRGSGTPNAIQGINLSNLNVTGTLLIRDVQFRNVLQGISDQSRRSTIENCVVAGTRFTGIIGGVVRDCVVKDAQTGGIEASVVTACSVDILAGSNFPAISASTIENTRATHLGAGVAIAGTVVAHCVGTGTSSTGISAAVVTDSFGQSTTGNGVVSSDTATNTLGHTADSASAGIGFTAFTAQACRGTKGAPAVVSQSITNKYNMP